MPLDQAFIDSLVRKRFDKTVDTSRFTCNENIDWYLRSVGAEYQTKKLSTVWCWLKDDDLAGYLTTSMTIVEMKESKLRQLLGLAGITFKKNSKHVHRFPGLLIGMLGTCDRYKRRGLAEHMIKFAIGQADRLSNETGCRLVTVDSDDTDEAIGLYTKLGFVSPEDQKRGGGTVWMYYDLKPF